MSSNGLEFLLETTPIFQEWSDVKASLSGCDFRVPLTLLLPVLPQLQFTVFVLSSLLIESCCFSQFLVVNAPKPPQCLPPILHSVTRVSWKSRFTPCILEWNGGKKSPWQVGMMPNGKA